MATFLKNCLTRGSALHRSTSLLTHSRLLRPYSVWQPDDVNLPPEIPEYSELCIRLRAYDFVTLESFSKYVHNLTISLGLDSESYPVPARTSTLKTFKPGTTNLQHTHDVARYERVVQVDDLPSTVAPILFEAVSQNLPEGVHMVVNELDPEEEEFRYVPDIMLMELQDQIAEIDKIREERRK